MKHTVKRALALFIALLLAMPTFAFAEAPEDPVIVIENAFDAADQEEIIASMDIDPSVSEAEALQLGDPDEPVDQDPGIIEGLTLDPEEPAGEEHRRRGGCHHRGEYCRRCRRVPGR
ncbi:MAG: hypothetical protein IKE76_06915 [Clostridia bacterium]|nr:hypothetical protein [Clostridia bacterium]